MISKLSDRIEYGLAVRRGKLKSWGRVSLPGPLGICLHTTGRGVLARAKRENTTPLQAAVRVYTQIMDPSPHYLIGYGGEIISIVDEDLVAWHAGSSNRESSLYALLPQQSAPWASWWRDRWPGAKSPNRLLDHGKNHGGNACLGIELLATEDGTWPEPQMVSLVALIDDIRARQRGATRVYQHADFCPYTRTTKAGRPWDLPESFPWHRLEQQP